MFDQIKNLCYFYFLFLLTNQKEDRDKTYTSRIINSFMQKMSLLLFGNIPTNHQKIQNDYSFVRKT